MTDREIDAKIAEMLGWKRFPDSHGMIVMQAPGVAGGMYDQFPHYSTNDGDALAAIDAAMKLHPDRHFAIYCYEQRTFVDVMDSDDAMLYEVDNESRPAAISLALVALAEVTP